jgi:hypothetical protein
MRGEASTVSVNLTNSVIPNEVSVMQHNSIKTMLLGLLLMLFGAFVVMSISTGMWHGMNDDNVLAIGSLVCIAGFITGVIGFFRKD